MYVCNIMCVYTCIIYIYICICVHLHIIPIDLYIHAFRYSSGSEWSCCTRFSSSRGFRLLAVLLLCLLCVFAVFAVLAFRLRLPCLLCSLVRLACLACLVCVCVCNGTPESKDCLRCLKQVALQFFVDSPCSGERELEHVQFLDYCMCPCLGVGTIRG